jgi:PAS domain S-box-containing protein
MIDKPVRLLLIEDNPGDARLIREYLSEIRTSRYLLECADRLSEGLELLGVLDVDLVLLDLFLPDSEGLDTFAAAQAKAPELPIVVVTGFDDEMLAVQAVQAGAQDYLVKGEIDSGLLSRAMRYAIERKKTEIALRKTREELEVRVEKRTADLATANEELRSEIAERNRVERALRREHAFRSAIIERAAEGLCVCHKVVERPFVKFTVWNERMTEITGYTMDDINRLGWYQSIHAEPKVRPQAVDRMARMWQGEDLIAQEWEIVRADREKRTVRISTCVLQNDDGLPHVLALVDDVTEQKKAEEALKKSHGFLEILVAERTIELRKTNALLLLETSERKRANEALRKAHQQLQDIIDFLPDATFVIDRQKRVIAWNRAIEEMTGVKQQEIIGKGDYMYAVPFYGEKRPIIIDLVMGCEDETERKYDFVERKEKTVYGEVLVPKAYRGKGAYLWGTASPLFDHDGNIIGAIQSIRDISDRKRAEEKVKQSEEKYRQLFETVPDAIFLLDADNRQFIDVNQSALQLYGYTRDEFLGLKHTEISTEPDLLKECLDETPGRTKAPLCYHRKKDGTIFPVELSSSAFDLPGKRILCGVVRDITERKRTEQELSGYRDHLEELVTERTAKLASTNEQLTCEVEERKRVEQALQESRQMLHSVLDTIPVRVFWKDPDLKYLGCNRPFALDAGFQSPEEIVGKDDFELAWREQAQQYRADDRLVIETGMPKIGYEENQTTPGGFTIWLRTSKVPMDDLKGQIKGVLGTYEDITVHKRAEEELREAHHELERRVEERTSALERANEELRQIPSKLISVQEEERKRLASELHDSIGQTLAAVKFWVEMSLQLRDEGDDNAALNHLGQFVPVLQRSIDETRRIYMGLRPSMLDNVGLLATLEWLSMECMKLYPARHIELEAGISEEEVPRDLKVNIFRIAQEALNNIAKHSKAEWVDISLSKNAGGLELTVSDDGVGMDLDVVMQTNATTSLGLTSMRERAELTGGNFLITSNPGEGTTIRALWPIETEDRLQEDGNTP